MAYTLDFNAVQSPTALNTLVITDTSSGGTDPAINSRRIYLVKSDGTKLVPSGVTTDYIDFPIVSGAGDTISLQVLGKDVALNINIVCTSTSPIVGATYVKTNAFCATGNVELETYKFLQSVAVNQSILNDFRFRNNLMALFTETSSAKNAAQYSDVASAQSALDKAYYIINNKQFNF